MRSAPWVPSQDVPNHVFRRSLDDEDDPVLVGEGSAEHDEAIIDESVHERRMIVPSGLRFERLRGVPFGALASLDHEEGWHHAVLALPRTEFAGPGYAVRMPTENWRSRRPRMTKKVITSQRGRFLPPGWAENVNRVASTTVA